MKTRQEERETETDLVSTFYLLPFFLGNDSDDLCSFARIRRQANMEERERERERSRVYFVISNGYKYICVYSHKLDYHAAVPETVPYMYVRMCLGNSSIKFG